MATTVKGERTKARIVLAAADLIAKHGVAGTSLDDVRERTSTSKSQLYHYFPDKTALLRDVVLRQAERVFDAQRPTLDHLDSWAAIERWCDELVAGKEKQRFHGSCPIGSLVTELAEVDPIARANLAASFERWEGFLASGLAKMKTRGELVPSADPQKLAVATIASFQGGVLLAQATRSTEPLRIALDAAIRHLRSWAAKP
jgi:AcrR family transcriptional regulator